jgi:chemotaxis protein methyltransferase CheR
MQITLPRVLLSQLSDLLATKMGLYYPEKRWGDLERAIAAAVPKLGLGDAETTIRQLVSTSLTRRQIEILACHLTVGETYFFRGRRCLDVLEESIFPELIRACLKSNRRLRIWSAGCCTGEEPYSIAILLDRLFKHDEEWNATILATDINPVFLNKAAEGVYGEWAFRGTPDWVKERYFKRRKNGLFEILPHIRKRVAFSYLNLAENTYPSLANNTSAMDIIFCRNVLMYFRPEEVRRAGQCFHQSLVDNGWLIVSPVEMSSDSFPRFRPNIFPGTALYQKIDSGEPQNSSNDYFSLGPSRDTLYGTAPALADPSHQRDWETSVSLESMQLQILSTKTNAFAQLTSAQDVANQSTNREKSDALYHRARFYANRGDLVKATRRCEEAIAANKLNPSTHYLLAVIQQESGQVEEAMQSLMNALYLDPNLVLAHFALGSLCLSHGKSRKAERHFDNALLLLDPYPPNEILPDSGGLAAGQLTQIITSIRDRRFARISEIKS